MGEYGRIVGESTGMGRGGGPHDVTGQVMASISDVMDRITSLPPEILVGIAVAIIIAWMLLRG